MFSPLSVCLFVNNFLTTVLVVEWWNFQGSVAVLRSGSDSFSKGQGQDRAKGEIHRIGYNFASNCHRDFKLGSHFSLWKAAPNMTLTLTFDLGLEMFAQGQNFRKIVKGEVESQPECQGQAKGQIHVIGCNFTSNCHRHFTLGSYFSLWKSTPNMTMTLTFYVDLEKFYGVKMFETYQLRKNVKGEGESQTKCQCLRSRSSKKSNSLNWL